MTRIVVNTKQQAWDKAAEIFPSKFEKDESRSERAGYPIFQSPVEHYDYICDLGNRLEINLKDGNQTINIWIEESSEQAEIRKLKARVAELEAMTEWEPYEYKENVPQASYEKLVKQHDTRFLTDDEAKEILYDWFGFAKEKVKILYTVQKFEINGAKSQIRVAGEYVRRPAYNATDWNYIRFDCGAMTYELHNDNLSFYVH